MTTFIIVLVFFLIFVTLLGLWYFFVKKDDISRDNKKYYLILIIMWTSTMLSLPYLTTYASSLYSTTSYLTLAFIGSLVGYAIGSFVLKTPIIIIITRYGLKKKIMAINYFLFGASSIILFGVSFLNDATISSIFLILNAILIGAVSGLILVNVNVFNDKDESKGIARNTAIVLMIPFIGRIFASAPQVILFNEIGDSLTEQSATIYLFLVSGILSILASLIDLMFISDTYINSKGKEVKIDKQQVKRNIEKWENLKWFENDEATKIAKRIGIITFLIFLVYYFNSGSLTIILLQEYDVNGTNKIYQGSIEMLFALGGTIATFSCYKLIKIKKANYAFNLAFGSMVVFLIINTTNIYTIQNVHLLYWNYILVSFSFGAFFYLFILIINVISLNKKRKFSIALFVALPISLAAIIIDSLIAILLVSFPNTNFSELQKLFSIVSIVLITLSFVYQVYRWNNYKNIVISYQ